MSLGGRARTVAHTNMNESSSRSHAIFTITFRQSARPAAGAGGGSEKVAAPPSPPPGGGGRLLALFVTL